MLAERGVAMTIPSVRPLLIVLHHACHDVCWRCRWLWASRYWLAEGGGEGGQNLWRSWPILNPGSRAFTPSVSARENMPTGASQRL
jgi:hypothetical protein